VIHQKSGRKLNLSSKHRKAFIRNQALHFIKYGKLKSTLAGIKEVRRLVEKLVTIARGGNDFNRRRHAYKLLPYDKKALESLFKDIAPKYVDRPGGYTRIYRLPQRISDTAKIGQLAWV
jgi:large subunit ribosomal protein L17